MALDTELTAFAERVATEFNTLRGEIPAGGGTDLYPVKMRTGYWYTTPVSDHKAGSIAHGALIFHEFRVPAGGRAVDAVAVRPNGTGATTRIGIYAPDANGQPGVRLFDLGSFATTAAGYYEAAISVTLPEGRVWIGVLPLPGVSTTQTFYCVDGTPTMAFYPDRGNSIGSNAPVFPSLTGQTDLPADVTGSVWVPTQYAPKVSLKAAA